MILVENITLKGKFGQCLLTVSIYTGYNRLISKYLSPFEEVILPSSKRRWCGLAVFDVQNSSFHLMHFMCSSSPMNY